MASSSEISKKDEITLIDYFILSLGIVCLSFSTYQTAKGYESLAGNIYLASVISVIITTILSILNLLLRNALKDGIPHKGFVIFCIYIVVALFSLLANFNSFYTNSMENKWIMNDLNTYYTELSAIKQKARIGLEQGHRLNKDADKIREKVNLYKTTLRIQILDPKNRGWGVESQKIADSIEKELGIPLTPQKGNPEDVANGIEKQIDNIVAIKFSNIDTEIKSIEKVINNLQAKIDSAKRIQDNKRSLIIIEQVATEYSSICARVTQTVNDSTIFKCESPKSINGKKIGNIEYSLSLINSIDAMVPLLIGILIDFIVPFLIFISSYKPSDKRKIPNRSFPIRNHKLDSENFDKIIDSKS